MVNGGGPKQELQAGREAVPDKPRGREEDSSLSKRVARAILLSLEADARGSVCGTLAHEEHLLYFCY